MKAFPPTPEQLGTRAPIPACSIQKIASLHPQQGSESHHARPRAPLRQSKSIPHPYFCVAAGAFSFLQSTAPFLIRLDFQKAPTSSVALASEHVRLAGQLLSFVIHLD